MTTRHASNGRQRDRTAPQPTAPAPVRTIPDDAVFRLDELAAVLKLPRTTLRREARLGRLAVSRRAGCYWCTGRQVHAWLAAGEHKPRRRAGAEKEAAA